MQENLHCPNCGLLNKIADYFCSNCGESIRVEMAKIQQSTEIDFQRPKFYSQDWKQSKFIEITSTPFFDLMVHQDNLYVIELPKYNGAYTGSILGLFVLNLLGAYIGYRIGASRDANKRKYYRTAWIDFNGNFTSNAYTNHIFLKIPFNSLKKSLSKIKKDKFTITYADKKITLKSNISCLAFYDFMSKNVLQ